MKTVLEDLAGCQKKLVFEVPPEEVNEELDKYCRKLAKEVNVRGFRKGKAPPSVLKRLFKQQILGEVASQIVASSFEKAVQEHALTPVGEPDIETPPLEEGKVFSFTVTVDVKPEIDVKDYLGIVPEASPLEVKEEEVEKSLEELRKVHAEVKDLEEARPVAVGDVVLVDYEGLLDGTPLPQESKKDVYLEIGAGSYRKDVEDALVGSTVGETREVEVAYPENHINKSLAGRTVVYRFEVKKLMKKELPVLDDEFAKSLGQGFETADALREDIASHLQSMADQNARRSYENKAVDALIESAAIEFPAVIAEKEIDRLIAAQESELQARKLSLEDYLRSQNKSREELREELQPVAVRNVSGSLALGKLAEAEKIEVSAAELDEEVEIMATNAGEQGENMRQLFQSPGTRKSLENVIITRKTVQRLVQIASGEADTQSAEAEPQAEPTQPAPNEEQTEASAVQPESDEVKPETGEGESKSGDPDTD